MRLDIPSPLGALILLANDRPPFTTSPISSTRQEEEEAGRPMEEN